MNDVYAIIRSLLLHNDDESRFALADMAEERGDGELVKLLREGVSLYVRHGYDMDASMVPKVSHHSAEAKKAFLMGIGYADSMDESGFKAFNSIAEVEASIQEEVERTLTRTCPRCHSSYVDLYEEGGQCPACDALDDDLIEYAEETDDYDI